MKEKNSDIKEKLYFCYSLNQFSFFEEYGIRYIKKLKSCNENKYVWLFENNKELERLRELWRNTYPYKRGDN